MTNMNNIMLDIETFGTNSNAAVISISAVRFCMETGEIGSKIEMGLDLNGQVAKGAVIDPETVMWWLSQSKDAQNELTRLKTIYVEDALESFNLFCGKDPNTKLWGNGATFDNVIVRNLYARHGVEFLVPFWCDNDVRTLVSIAGIKPKDFEFVGVKHRGIDDCLHQIKYCTYAYKSLKGELS